MVRLKMSQLGEISGSIIFEKGLHKSPQCPFFYFRLPTKPNFCGCPSNFVFHQMSHIFSFEIGNVWLLNLFDSDVSILHRLKILLIVTRFLIL